MNKSIKMSLLVVALVSAGTAWAAALTADNGNFTQSTTGTSSDTITNATYFSEPITVKMSKNVRGAYNVSAGGGAAGVATGHPNGKGNIYPNGTSATAGNVSPQSVGIANVTDANVLTWAGSAMS